ncbi:MAG: hypothetical protein Q4D86_09890 [Pasteurella oralis]|nr:hypothetical protein [Pasteurella oralis]
MPKIIAPLTNMAVDKAKPKDKEYSLSDEKSLFLRIKTTGSKV